MPGSKPDLPYGIERLLAVAEAYEMRSGLEMRAGRYQEAARLTSEARGMREGAHLLAALLRAAEAIGDVPEDGPTPVVEVKCEGE